jgi:hypothetical protein
MQSVALELKVRQARADLVDRKDHQVSFLCTFIEKYIIYLGQNGAPSNSPGPPGPIGETGPPGPPGKRY